MVCCIHGPAMVNTRMASGGTGSRGGAGSACKAGQDGIRWARVLQAVSEFMHFALRQTCTSSTALSEG